METDFQFSATEIADAIAWLRHRDELLFEPADLWEEDLLHEGLPEDTRDALRELISS